jgi:basic membrane protein A and related proteins
VKKAFPASAALVAAALIAAACGNSTSAPSSSSSSSSGSNPSAAAAGKFLGCMVTDTGGIDDRSFNSSSWQGMQAAQTADPGKISVTYLQSTTQSDYTPNINTFIGRKCGTIVTVGFLMGTATQTAAKANPNQKFAIVDYNYTPPLKNVDALLFNTVQDGFEGGYLAAGMTKTGKVATFGGQKLPTVTIYMDGFYDGVQYYNSQHHTNVQVLGWNEASQNGSFTGNFTDQTAGQQLTQTFITEGADIIFPVAGNVGLGAAKAVQDADAAAGSQKVNMMWVDTDGCISAPQYCKYFITSVEKGIQTAVKGAVSNAANGTFTGGNYIGTLANDGVTLAPYHDFASKVPGALQSELATVKADIISGKIKPATKSPV